MSKYPHFSTYLLSLQPSSPNSAEPKGFLKSFKWNLLKSTLNFSKSHLKLQFESLPLSPRLWSAHGTTTPRPTAATQLLLAAEQQPLLLLQAAAAGSKAAAGCSSRAAAAAAGRSSWQQPLLLLWVAAAGTAAAAAAAAAGAPLRSVMGGYPGHGGVRFSGFRRRGRGEGVILYCRLESNFRF